MGGHKTGNEREFGLDGGNNSPHTSRSSAGWLQLGQLALVTNILLRKEKLPLLLAWTVVAAAIIWAYGGPIWGLAVRWWKEADYGHGFFVPIFSVILLVIRWKEIKARSFRVTPAALVAGIMLLALTWACRYVSHAYYVRLLEPASIIPALGALALLAGGWNGLRWAWPSIVFLVFMIPLPGALADALRHPLQRIGTIGSAYLLQVLGVPCVARGNIIVLSSGELGVVEACSGLRMMVLFFAVCVGAAFLVRRPLLDRILIILSAPVIAVLSNIFRITVTGLLHELTTPQFADYVFHDLAGWLMAPVALALLAAEMWWLDRVLVTPPAERPVLAVDVKKPQNLPPTNDKRELTARAGQPRPKRARTKGKKSRKT